MTKPATITLAATTAKPKNMTSAEKLDLFTNVYAYESARDTTINFVKALVTKYGTSQEIRDVSCAALVAYYRVRDGAWPKAEVNGALLEKALYEITGKVAPLKDKPLSEQPDNARDEGVQNAYNASKMAYSRILKATGTTSHHANAGNKGAAKKTPAGEQTIVKPDAAPLAPEHKPDATEAFISAVVNQAGVLLCLANEGAKVKGTFELRELITKFHAGVLAAAERAKVGDKPEAPKREAPKPVSKPKAKIAA